MARSNAAAKQGGGKGSRTSRGKSKNTGTASTAATASAAGSNESHEEVLPEWDEVTEDLTVLPDIDGLIGKPAANHGNDAEARRRIERLREERQLQQALSDVFDL
jgi:hypothetical protein